MSDVIINEGRQFDDCRPNKRLYFGGVFAWEIGTECSIPTFDLVFARRGDNFIFSLHDGSPIGKYYGTPTPAPTTPSPTTPAPTTPAPTTPPPTTHTQLFMGFAGGNHTLFIKSNGDLYAAGLGSQGQLGQGESSPGSGVGSNSTVPVLIDTGVITAAAGEYATFYIKSDNSLWATGNNLNGQLGNGNTTRQFVPIQIASGVASVKNVIGGSRNFSIFRNAGNQAFVMGQNDIGEFGIPSPTSSTTPVSSLTNVIDMITGGFHSLYLKADATLWASGFNSRGQLGDTTTSTRTTAVQVATGVISIAAGLEYSLFVKSDNTLWGMGRNSVGQLGNGTTTLTNSTPIQITTGVLSCFAANTTSMFIKTDNTLWGMGQNFHGELGQGNTTQQLSPVQVDSNVALASMGGVFAIYTKINNTVWVTGDNTYGKFGQGNTTPALTPLQITI